MNTGARKCPGIFITEGKILMPDIKMVISIVCALFWTYNGLSSGFDLFGICATALWWLAAALFTYAFIKRRKNGGNENG